MPKWVNIDKRAHTAAQRNLCESCGYGTQLPRAPKKPFSEGLGKFGDRPNFQKRRHKKQTVSLCWGKIWIMAWTSQYFSWGTQEEAETNWCDSVLQRRMPVEVETRKEVGRDVVMKKSIRNCFYTPLRQGSFPSSWGHFWENRLWMGIW